jgi:2'-5' RNA ligase
MYNMAVMKKRIFVGIKIQPELYLKIDNWRKKYLRLPVRWIDNNNLHITLIPPWYEDGEGIIRRVKEVKEAIEGLKAFNISFNNVCLSPTLSNPRLIWAEGEIPEELLTIKSKLEKILGQEPEKREYKLHLTLARFSGRDYKLFSINNINDNVIWEQTIDSFCLFESLLSSKGAEYKTIKDFRIT